MPPQRAAEEAVAELLRATPGLELGALLRQSLKKLVRSSRACVVQAPLRRAPSCGTQCGERQVSPTWKATSALLPETRRFSTTEASRRRFRPALRLTPAAHSTVRSEKSPKWRATGAETRACRTSEVGDSLSCRVRRHLG